MESVSQFDSSIDFINAKDFKELSKNLGLELKIKQEGNTIISGTGVISPDYFAESEKEFLNLKVKFEEVLKEYGLTFEKYLQDQTK